MLRVTPRSAPRQTKMVLLRLDDIVQSTLALGRDKSMVTAANPSGTWIPTRPILSEVVLTSVTDTLDAYGAQFPNWETNGACIVLAILCSLSLHTNSFNADIRTMPARWSIPTKSFPENWHETQHPLDTV